MIEEKFGIPYKGDYNPVYPRTAVDDIPKGTPIVSPRVGNAHGLKEPFESEEAYRDALAEVVEVRAMVARGEYPAEFLKKHHPDPDFDPYQLPAPFHEPYIPESLSTDNPAGMADIVHMDDPFALFQAIHKWLLKTEVPHKNPTGYVDFIERHVWPKETGAKRLVENFEIMFEIKAWFGQCRPQESLRVDGGIFTHYPEGCPWHESFTAGHSASAATPMALDEDFILDKVARRVIFDCMYLWTIYRILAGVHTVADCLAGLMVLGAWDEYWVGVPVDTSKYMMPCEAK